MAPTQLTIFYVTFDSEEKAKDMAKVLLSEKLIVCANVLSPMTAVYTWEDKVNEDKEWPALFKTSVEKASALRSRIEELHNYDTPCIIELALESVNTSYENWALTQL